MQAIWIGSLGGPVVSQQRDAVRAAFGVALDLDGLEVTSGEVDLDLTEFRDPLGHAYASRAVVELLLSMVESEPESETSNDFEAEDYIAATLLGDALDATPAWYAAMTTAAEGAVLKGCCANGARSRASVVALVMKLPEQRQLTTALVTLCARTMDTVAVADQLVELAVEGTSAHAAGEFERANSAFSAFRHTLEVSGCHMRSVEAVRELARRRYGLDELNELDELGLKEFDELKELGTFVTVFRKYGGVHAPLPVEMGYALLEAATGSRGAPWVAMQDAIIGCALCLGTSDMYKADGMLFGTDIVSFAIEHGDRGLINRLGKDYLNNLLGDWLETDPEKLHEVASLIDASRINFPMMGRVLARVSIENDVGGAIKRVDAVAALFRPHNKPLPLLEVVSTSKKLVENVPRRIVDDEDYEDDSELYGYVDTTVVAHVDTTVVAHLMAQPDVDTTRMRDVLHALTAWADHGLCRRAMDLWSTSISVKDVQEKDDSELYGYVDPYHSEEPPWLYSQIVTLLQNEIPTDHVWLESNGACIRATFESTKDLPTDPKWAYLFARGDVVARAAHMFRAVSAIARSEGREAQEVELANEVIAAIRLLRTKAVAIVAAADESQVEENAIRSLKLQLDLNTF